MLRPLEAGNSIKQLIIQSDTPEELRGIIKKVNRVTRHVHVLVGGYGLLRSVPVNRGINLGTPDRKVVFPGDTAVIVKGQRGWQCVSIEHKDRCGSKTSEFVGDVVIENEVEPVSGDSYTSQQIGALSLPTDLYLPPFQLLGNLTLPDERFDDLLLCGLPPCTDCSPTGFVLGYVLKISSDSEHPSGCWIWGPRGGVVEGIWVLYTTTDTYFASVDSATPATLVASSSCISPSSASTITTLNMGDPVWSFNGFEIHFLYSNDSGGAWNTVFSSEIRNDPIFANAKVKFDRGTRSKGYMAAGGVVSVAESAGILAAFSVAPDDYTAVQAGVWIRNNYLSGALKAIISNDGGASWTEYILDYTGDIYRNVYSNYLTGGAPCDLGDGIYSFIVGSTYYRVCGTVTNTNGAPSLIFFEPFVGNFVVCPLENGLGSYFIYGIQYAVADYDPLNAVLTGTNRIYLVEPDGSQTGVIEVDVGDYGDSTSSDFIWVAETDPLDNDKFYAITFESHNLLQISFSGGLTILTAPYDMVADRLGDILLTPLGTILIPVVTAIDELLVYRSTDQGSSFTPIDLTAFMGSNPAATFPVLGQTSTMVFLATDAGKLVYSTDDGLTWLASDVILPVDNNLTDIDG